MTLEQFLEHLANFSAEDPPKICGVMGAIRWSNGDCVLTRVAWRTTGKRFDISNYVEWARALDVEFSGYLLATVADGAGGEPELRRKLIVACGLEEQDRMPRRTMTVAEIKALLAEMSVYRKQFEAFDPVEIDWC